MYKDLLEPITIDMVKELQPGEWIWDDKPIMRSVHKLTLSRETVVEPIGFRQIHILSSDFPGWSNKPFMLTDTERGYYKWEYFERGRYYRFKKKLEVQENG